MARRPVDLLPGETVVAEIRNFQVKARRVDTINGDVTVTNRRIIVRRRSTLSSIGVSVDLPLDQVTSVSNEGMLSSRRVDVTVADRTYRFHPTALRGRKDDAAALVDAINRARYAAA